MNYEDTTPLEVAVQMEGMEDIAALWRGACDERRIRCLGGGDRDSDERVRNDQRGFACDVALRVAHGSSK